MNLSCLSGLSRILTPSGVPLAMATTTGEYVHYEEEIVPLTAEFVGALESLMRANLAMMRAAVPERADCWQRAICHIEDLACEGISFSYGGNEEREGEGWPAPPGIDVAVYVHRHMEEPQLIGSAADAFDPLVTDPEARRRLKELGAALRYALQGGDGQIRLIFLDIDGVLNSSAWHDHRHDHRQVHLPLSGYPSLEGLEGDEYWAAYSQRRARNLDPDCIERLNRLVEATGALVVIASSWREAADTPAALLRLEETLGIAGYRHSLFSQTPDLSIPPVKDSGRFEDTLHGPGSQHLYYAPTRWTEIHAWLSRQRQADGTNCFSNYVILDDDLISGAPSGRQIRTDRRVGLTDADVDRAIVLLVTGGEK